MTMLKLTDCELHQMGLQVFGSQIVPIPDKPDESWGLDRLTTYVQGELANSKQAKQEALLHVKKSAVHLYWAGCALSLARDKCKAESRGSWVKWQKDQGLHVSTVNEAIRLYEEAKTEDAVAGLGITEAKKMFVFPKKEDAASEEATLPTQGRRGSRRPRNGEWQPEKPIEEEKSDLLAELAGIETVLANWVAQMPVLADGDRQTAVETVARIKKHLEEIFNAAA